MKLNKKKKFDTKKLEKIIKNKNTYYNFFLFIIGMALSAISVSVFYSPNEVVTTGSTGLAIILNKYLNIDLSLLVLCLSSMLLVFCMRKSISGSSSCIICLLDDIERCVNYFT